MFPSGPKLAPGCAWPRRLTPQLRSLCVEQLEDFLADRTGGFVTRLFETMRSDVGLPEMTLHGLRHMHASLLLASGTDIALVSKRLGHSSISITITIDIYTHLIGDAGRRAEESAAALIPRASAQQVHNEPSGAGMTKAPEPRISA